MEALARNADYKSKVLPRDCNKRTAHPCYTNPGTGTSRLSESKEPLLRPCRAGFWASLLNSPPPNNLFWGFSLSSRRDEGRYHLTGRHGAASTLGPSGPRSLVLSYSRNRTINSPGEITLLVIGVLILIREDFSYPILRRSPCSGFYICRLSSEQQF